MTPSGNGDKTGRIGRPPHHRHRARSHEHAHSQSPGHGPTQHKHHPLACSDRPQLITRSDELAELLHGLRAAGSFAYDSEFIGELTYLPRLCLIQAATSTRVALIDPLADLDVRPFWELVADASIEKVVHAGTQDVEPVFRAVGKPPANLFDTQITAGFAGIGYPLSLSKLVFSVVGAKLGKGLTFSHWDHRPLTDHQLRYAADDVRYLPAVRHELGKKLEGMPHVAWAREESESLADPSLHVFDPQTQWMKIRGAPLLPGVNQAILRELVAWREGAAAEEDVPPRTMVKDEILLEMSRNPIDSVADLARVKGLPRPVEDKYGEAILAATNKAKALPPAEHPAIALHEPSPEEKFRADSLFYATQTICAGQQIDPNLVTSRQEIGELYRLLSGGKDPAKLRILRGWRREAAGQKLLDIHAGKADFSAKWDGLGLILE
jgi:ribonuclease D